MTEITWKNQGVLHVEIHSQTPVDYPLLKTERPSLPDDLSVQSVLDAIETAYQQGYELHASVEEELQGVVFGGRGDPLLALDILLSSVERFKKNRHGVPVSVVTFGLVAQDDMESIAAGLVDAGVEGLQVFLPATNPAEYARLLKVETGIFGGLCQFIESCVSAGLRVRCFAHVGQQALARDLRALATALGAVGFEIIEPS